VNAVSNQQEQEQEQRKQIRRTVMILAAVAMCFYFGFIISTALKG
jgi:hypothetical protein